MSEQASTPAEAPSPAPAPVVAPAPAVATPASSNDSIYTADELAAIEAAASGTLKPATDGKKGEYEVAELTASDALVIPPELTAPAAKPAEPAAPQATKPEDEDDDADPLQAIKGIKLKPTSFQDMEVLRLMKPRAGKPGLTAAEAVAKVYGTAAAVTKPEPAAPAAAPAAETPAEPAADPETAAIQSEIAALETEVEKASADMDVGKGVKLARRIAAKERQLERIEAERTAAARAAEQAKATEAETSFQQRVTTAAKEVYAARPSLADKASADRAEFDAFLAIKNTDPDYEGIFKSPRWPSVLYREFAEAKGWNKAPAPVRTPALPAPTPGAPAAPRVTQATALVPGETPGGSGAPTTAQLLASLDSMDPKALFALLPSK